MLVLSALGAANMAAISLRQLGVIAHLPDPPLRGFDADRVTVDRQAWIFGIPDAPIETLALLANIPLARLASGAAAERFPWLPVLLGAKTLTEAAVALWYFEHMRTRVGVWCAYCIAGAGVNVALATLALPVARRGVARSSPAVVAGIALAALGGVLLWRLGRGRTGLPRAGRDDRPTAQRPQEGSPRDERA
jgi:hypothetical protein